MADNSMEIKTLLELDKQTMDYLKEIRDVLVKSSSNSKGGGSRSTTSSSTSSKAGGLDLGGNLGNLNKAVNETSKVMNRFNSLVEKNNARVKKNLEVERLKTERNILTEKSNKLQASYFGSKFKSPLDILGTSLKNKAKSSSDLYDALNTEAKKLEYEKNILTEALGKEEDPQKRRAIESNLAVKNTQIRENDVARESAKNKMLSASRIVGVFTDITKNLPDKLNKVFGKIQSFYKIFGIDLKNTFKDISDRVRLAFEKQGIASYNLASSIFTNAQARESAMKYGLSSSQNYALTKTMGVLNLQSEEDLMYMNQEQKAYFNELMKKYGDWYTKLERTGVFKNVQEMQLEFEMFKEEVTYTLLEWFSDNKELILNVMQGTLDIFEKILTIITKIASKLNVKGLGDSASTSDGLSVIQSAKNSTYNINTNSTNNISTGINSTQDLVNAMDTSNSNYLKGLAVAINSFD